MCPFFTLIVQVRENIEDEENFIHKIKFGGKLENIFDVIVEYWLFKRRVVKL